MREHSTERQEKVEDEKDTGRLEAFSDGVFAVAITLLVLDIKIPEIDLKNLPSDIDLQKLFQPQLLNFSAFVISFFTIGIMWMNHHKIFKQIKRTDTGLLLLNLLLLLIIVFIPVPTALLADYLRDSTNHFAAVLYSGTFFAMAVCFNLLWRYASHNGRLLGKGVNMEAVKAIDRQYLFGPLLYIVALILAFINTPISALFQFILALFFALPGRPPRSRSPKGKVTAKNDSQDNIEDKQEEREA